MKLDPAILIYIDVLKEFFKKNDDATEYFFDLPKRDVFYTIIISYSLKNMEERGFPQLTKEQFDEIREKLKQRVNAKKRIDGRSKEPVIVMNELKFEKLLYLN